MRATTIIFCTGYSKPRSFLPPSCPAPSKAAYRLIVAPEWPTIAHMGHIRFWDGAIGPTAEMQAMWYLAYLEGRMKQLPKSEAHYSLLSPEGGYMSHGVDYSAYMATLAEDIGAKPNPYISPFPTSLWPLHFSASAGNGKTTARGWAQYNTTPVHEYEGLDFEKLAYIAPGSPPPISATSISTTVTPLTIDGDSTPRHLLTDNDRRRMCEYHGSYLGN